MKILYECGCCGSKYDNEKDAHNCEVAHKEWLNSEIEDVNNKFSCGLDGTPDKICLRNKNGKSYVYTRFPI